MDWSILFTAIYNLSCILEAQFIYTRDNRQHPTLFSYMGGAPAVVEEEDEEDLDYYDDHLSHSHEDYKRPNLDPISQGNLFIFH